MLFLVPLLLSCVYGNKVITIGLGLAGILIKGILDSAMYLKVWAHYVVEEPYDKTLVIMNFVLYAVIMLVVIYFCISVINVEKKKRVLAIELEQEIRLGGDEFMVYASEMEQAKTEEKAKELLEKCKRTLLTPDQKEIQIGISIGITQFPTDGEHYNILYANADAALYKAKKSGKGDYVFF